MRPRISLVGATPNQHQTPVGKNQTLLGAQNTCQLVESWVSIEISGIMICCQIWASFEHWIQNINKENSHAKSHVFQVSTFSCFLAMMICFWQFWSGSPDSVSNIQTFIHPPASRTTVLITNVTSKIGWLQFFTTIESNPCQNYYNNLFHLIVR